VYLILWCVWIFMFYSLGNSKLIPYILPAMVPLAGLVALGVPCILQNNQKDWTMHTGMILMTMLGITGMIAPHFVALDMDPDVMLWVKIMMCAFCLLSAFYYKMPKWRLGFLGASSVILIITAHIVSPHIQKTSVEPLAAIINDQKNKGDVIVSMGSYFQDLPVYTQTAPIVCVEAISELEYGMNVGAPKTLEWMLTESDFIQKFGPGSGRPFWAIARLPMFEAFQKKVPHWGLEIKGQNKELILFYHSGQ
ncbi:MAG: hypothetical protein Q8K36_02985, partial [Alphaproteobacteria bacterium]|nr:hypothetical protein [Alphaproteobacteria bacterium]